VFTSREHVNDKWLQVWKSPTFDIEAVANFCCFKHGQNFNIQIRFDQFLNAFEKCFGWSSSIWCREKILVLVVVLSLLIVVALVPVSH